MVGIMDRKLAYATISIEEIFASGGRLEASVFNIAAKHARELIAKCRSSKKPLSGPNGLVSAYLLPRFKRPYVDGPGVPFYQPSQITELLPAPARYLAFSNSARLDPLRVKKGQILLTCSGTVGECSIVGKHLDNAVFSHDLIRMDAISNVGAGYIYAFLRSKIGNLLLTTSNYGAVVQHIEPFHLEAIQLPVLNDGTVETINAMIIKSLNLRDESNDLIINARTKILESLDLPLVPIINRRDVISFSVPSLNLDDRFDGSFHNPFANAIEKVLSDRARITVRLDSLILSREIILPGRFKRLYVEEEYGVPFIGGKGIGNLDPRTGKYLSLRGHGVRIKDQLTIKENQILITCSGTIGKVNIAPKHWNGWASSQHIIRIDASSDEIAGYLYAWLSTEYGRLLVQRFTYGSVVDEIDDTHVGRVPVPLLEEMEMREIGELVLLANRKRYEAFQLEKKALELFDRNVFGIEQR